jgi:hypothetical protein
MHAEGQDEAGLLHGDLLREKGLTLVHKVGTPGARKASYAFGVPRTEAHIHVGKETRLHRDMDLGE